MKSQNTSAPLTAKYVEFAEARHEDGELKVAKYYDGPGSGLYLRVTPTGYKYWEVRLTVNGRRRTRGLGPYPALSLKEAREKAQELRVRVRNGENPFGARGGRELTFAEAAAHAMADREIEVLTLERRLSLARAGAAVDSRRTPPDLVPTRHGDRWAWRQTRLSISQTPMVSRFSRIGGPLQEFKSAL